MRHAHQRRTQEPLAQPVAAANLLGHMLVGQVVAIHRAQRLMQTGIEGLAHGGHRLHVQLAQDLFHLFHDQLHAVAQLVSRAVGLERQLEVIHHGQKLLHHIASGMVAKFSRSRSARLRAFSNSACSRARR